MIAVVSPSSTSTSGLARVGMKPCTNALYVSLTSRCDSAAIVSNTRELLPEPETPVNTVTRRFGSSTLTSFRLFSRAPCTLIRSWVSATCGAVGPSALAVMFVMSPWVVRARCPLRSPVLNQPEDVAVGVGEGGHEAATADVVRLLLHRGAGSGHLGQLRFDVRHVPVSHRRGHALRPAAWHQPDLLALCLEANVIRPVGL